jgi:hypothetical protein
MAASSQLRAEWFKWAPGYNKALVAISCGAAFTIDHRGSRVRRDLIMRSDLGTRGDNNEG